MKSSNEINHEKYKQYRNCLKQLLRRTKQEYYIGEMCRIQKKHQKTVEYGEHHYLQAQ